MAEYLTNTSELTAVADAIRTKGGTTGQLSYPAGFVSAISNISTGITPSGTISITSNGTYNVTNYASASVNVSGGSGYTVGDIAERNMMSGSIYGGTASFIASYAFYNAKSITNASFPLATIIYGNAFQSCTSLTNISMPAVVDIRAFAFESCTKLRSVSFPNLEGIGNTNRGIFSNCPSLSEAFMPKITTLPDDTFYSTALSGDAYAFFPALTSILGNAFERTKFVSFIHPGVTYVSGSVFANCASLKTVEMTQLSFASTGTLFNYCPNLETVNLPLLSHASSLFSMCSSLTTVTLPALEYISGGIANQCYNLSEVVLPKIRSIYGNRAFYRCYKLLSLNLTGVSQVPLLSGTSNFSSTPIGGYTTSTGGVYGSVFVPASLYNSFLTATNWSTISARIVSV